MCIPNGFIAEKKIIKDFYIQLKLIRKTIIFLFILVDGLKRDKSSPCYNMSPQVKFLKSILIMSIIISL